MMNAALLLLSMMIPSQQSTTVPVYVYGFNPLPYPQIGWGGVLCGWLPGDFDWDGDVDIDDFLPFETCASGPAIELPRHYPDGTVAACWLCDFDNDWDVDQNDFGAFQLLIGNFIGDVDGDGDVDEDDYAKVVYCADHESDPTCAACNLDGSHYPPDEITQYDIQMAYRLVFHAVGP